MLLDKPLLGSPPSEDSDESKALAAIIYGVTLSYVPVELEKFVKDHHNNTEEVVLRQDQSIAGVLVAVAVDLMAHNRLMPEDLISAVIDYLPSGSLFDNPYRAKLLAAQDYLEERQTLVNNIIANDLDIDIMEIDKRNVARCEAGDEIPGAIAAAFYIVTARKTSFEEAIQLALGAKKKRVILVSVGAISGAMHGLGGIPLIYKERLMGSIINERQ